MWHMPGNKRLAIRNTPTKMYLFKKLRWGAGRDRGFWVYKGETSESRPISPGATPESRRSFLLTPKLKVAAPECAAG